MRPRVQRAERAHPSAWMWAALAACLVAAWWPYLAPAAGVVLFLTGLTQGVRPRWWLGLSVLLLVVGAVRFIVEVAAPNIVAGGMRSSQEKAVSRLREILWAQDKLLEAHRMDRNGDGQWEYGLMGDLVDTGTRDSLVPILRPGTYKPQAPLPGGNIPWSAEGYLYLVYLPAAGGGWTASPAQAVDATQSGTRFLAVAWPQLGTLGGTRVFALNEHEVICEATTPDGAAPEAPAVLNANGVLDCTNPGWRSWKGKKARVP